MTQWKYRMWEVVGIIFFCLTGTLAEASGEPEKLVISYSLKEAQQLHRFATRTCKLPKVEAMLVGSGIMHKNPPEAVKFQVPKTFKTKASWYGGSDGFNGKLMANGELFDHADPTTAASQFLPIGTVLNVYWTYYKVEVIVKDRGACKPGRGIDLSRAAASKLGITEIGVAPVIAVITKLGQQ